MKLKVALGQFPIAEIDQNYRYVCEQMRTAADSNADVISFSESALGGYASYEFESFAGYDWSTLEALTRQIIELARELKIWVVLGSNHRLSGKRKPHNSLYLINAQGKLVNRYDKRFCVGKPGEFEHKHYSPGVHPVTFDLKGVKCGLLICHEWRYAELYREYKAMGVEVVFQSWYDGRLTQAAYEEWGTAMGEAILAGAQTRAGCNALWICGSNTSHRESCFGNFVVQPDGRFAARARRNQASVLLYTIDTEREFQDLSGPWRARAAKGQLFSGKPPLDDPRSTNRQDV